MPGQHSHLKEKYGPPPIDDQRKQDKINEEKLKLPKTPAELGAKYFEFRAEKDRLLELVSEADTRLQAVEQLLVDWLEGIKLTSFKLNNGNLLYIQDTPYSKVVDRDKFHQWVRDTNQEDLFSVHYQTMNGLVAQMLSRGEQEPPGTAFYIQPRIRPRKA
jgi:hypothetical protein